MDSSISPKDEICFLRVCHHISNAVYEVPQHWRSLHNWELHSLNFSPNAIRLIESRGWDGLDMWHVWGRGEVHTGSSWGNLRERDPMGMSERRWEDNINMQPKGYSGTGACIGLSWLRIGTSGRLMKVQVPQNAGISWQAEELWAPQEGLCCMQSLVGHFWVCLFRTQRFLTKYLLCLAALIQLTLPSTFQRNRYVESLLRVMTCRCKQFMQEKT
jgi:hypothetical protein